MIASLRGLVALAAIAIALGVVLVVAAPDQPVAVDRRLMRDTVEPTELAWMASGKAQVIVRRTDTTWTVTAEPRPVPADSATIDAVLSALRGAKWHRRAAASVAGAMSRELHVGTRTLGLGAELAGAQQTWLIDDHQALLVDSWVARALFPEPLALRVRHPLADAAVAEVIDGPNSVRLHGRFQDRPVIRWVAEQPFTALTDAIAAIEIVSLDGMKPADTGRAVALSPGGVFAQEAGTCDGDRVRLQTQTGYGCVERAAWDRVLAAFATLEREDAALVDRRPVPFAPTVVDFQGGKRLQLDQTPPSFDSQPANPDAVAALLAAFAEPAEIVPRPAGKPVRSMSVWGKGVKLELDIFADVIARHDETFALRPSPASPLFDGELTRLENPLRWHEDVHTLTTIEIDGVTYKSGTVIGEWTREPAGAIDNAIVTAVAEALATMRAPKGPFAPKRMFHRLTLTFTPPVGAPTTHRMEVGNPGPDGCPATVDRAPVRLSPETCTAIAALAAAKR